MSETPPEGPVIVEPPAGMGPEEYEFWDDTTLTYYERQDDGTVISRPYNENEVAQYQARAALDSLQQEAATAIGYLSDRIDLSLAFLALTEPTAEETAAQIKVLSDLAAYSAGTLKRVIKVLSVLLNRPV
ncbi:hypothetical protein EDD96_2337 [Streptomyces sp. Ag109_G2-6]|uniref:hypothetical protein n=1 Tax=Streptomyces sp. Ag109_G2-6 TaxID=2485154 RepID=UPI000F4E11F4|nr:hypothetical protein [Streptomyces sp. Ag109_G2-6]RPF45773.1 hypothetical protein EDD96_2337 [Streptomyces sp. Ag109_G2-6]